MIYCNPSEDVLCDACGDPVEYNPATYPNYDGVFHRRCANPTETEDGLLIGYNNVVVGINEERFLKDNEYQPHPPDCDCAWCTPLAWGNLTPVTEY